MKREFKQAVANSLIGLILLNAASWAPAAMANESKVTHLTYDFSLGIPNEGAIDLYHNAYTTKDPVSNSLYVLRNSAVEDLLNTRRSLKVLLGGTERLRRVSGKYDLSFDVPGGVVDLYLLGRLGAQNSATPQIRPSNPLAGLQ